MNYPILTRLRAAQASASGDPENCVIENSEIEHCDIQKRSDLFTKMPFEMIPAPFNRKDVIGWFRQLEAIFAVSNIVDDSVKYSYAQAKIDPSVLTEINDFFSNPPIENKYEELKKRVLAEFSDSPVKNAQKLIQGLTLEDRRPT